MIKSTGDQYDELKYGDRQKNGNIYNNQPGNRITGLKLESNVV